MPMLSITCKNCKKAFPTGIEMSYDAYRNATLMVHVARCPYCNHEQKWTLDDVDRSVFKPQK